MTRSRDSGSILIVTLAGQKIAGYQVVSIMAEQAPRREQPRGKVRVIQLLLPVGHAEAFVLRAGGGKIARAQTSFAGHQDVEAVLAGHGRSVRL